jgi:hypothetical protein
MDTLTVTFQPAQFDAWTKILESSRDSGLSPQTATLLAAIIGALAGSLPQLVYWIFNRRQQKRREILEIRSEETRLAALVKGLYRNLAFLSVAYEYYGRVFEDKIEPDYATSLEQFHYFRDELAKCHNEISITIADYTKLVARYSLLAHAHTNLVATFDTIYAQWQQRIQDSSDFAGVKDMEELTLKNKAEYARLLGEFENVRSCFQVVQKACE